MTLDATLRPTAQSLISRFGKSVVFTKPGEATFDPVTGKTTPGTPTDTTVKVTPPASFKVSEVDGTMIQRSDLSIACAALDYVPDINQSVTFDSVKYNIINVSPVYSGEKVAYYQCQVRK